MKVVHHDKEIVSDNDDLLYRAGEYEKKGELKEAAGLYLRYLKKIPGNEFAYSRLMIIYRKQKDPAKELDIINRGIKAFEEIFKKATKITPTRKTIEISKKLMKAMGLTDKKGKELYEREPIKKWNRRKVLLEKRKKKA
jgi:tetratricopeptide (TPR) repeat protein